MIILFKKKFRFSDPLSNSRVEYPSSLDPHNPLINKSQQSEINSPKPFPIGENLSQPQNMQKISMIRQQNMQGHQSLKNLLYPQQSNFRGNNYTPQAQTPTSSIISSATNSPRNFPFTNNRHYYNQQQFQYSQQAQNVQKSSIINRDIQLISFYKDTGSLGIRVVGGNQGGIFVSMIQEDSPAAQNGIR